MSTHKGPDSGVRVLELLGKAAPYVKAIAAGAGAFTASLAVAAADGTTTGGEWLQVAAATLTAAGATYAAPKNRERDAG